MTVKRDAAVPFFPGESSLPMQPMIVYVACVDGQVPVSRGPGGQRIVCYVSRRHARRHCGANYTAVQLEFK